MFFDNRISSVCVDRNLDHITVVGNGHVTLVSNFSLGFGVALYS